VLQERPRQFNTRESPASHQATRSIPMANAYGSKRLIYLVGVTGFEPATYTSRNSILR
jgi:hypothetical protein